MTYAIQYRRFSSDIQGKDGRDSETRQSKEFYDFCRRHDLTPWDDHAINDDGTSAYDGHNVRVGNLGDLVELARSGAFKEGSVVLVVENQDRLSRDKVGETLNLFQTIVRSGVWIGDALTDKIVTKDDLNDPLVLMTIIIGAARAYDYSLSLSKRLKSKWRAKRDNAAKVKLTKTCPQWLTLSPRPLRVHAG